MQGNKVVTKTGFKGKHTSKLHQDEDVLFWWPILCAATEVDNDCCQALLPYIVDHCVLIQGFVFAVRWIEVFKQDSKTNSNIQKALNLQYCSILMIICCLLCYLGYYPIYAISIVLYSTDQKSIDSPFPVS